MLENLSEKAIERDAQTRRQSKNNSLPRNYATNDRMLLYKLLQSALFTDTMFASKNESTKENKCCQVFISDTFYISVYQMKSQDELETALH